MRPATWIVVPRGTTVMLVSFRSTTFVAEPRGSTWTLPPRPAYVV